MNKGYRSSWHSRCKFPTLSIERIRETSETDYFIFIFLIRVKQIIEREEKRIWREWTVKLEAEGIKRKGWNEIVNSGRIGPGPFRRMSLCLWSKIASLCITLRYIWNFLDFGPSSWASWQDFSNGPPLFFRPFMS